MGDPVRIAQVAPLAVRVPPHRYGGTERVVHALTEELVRRGHEVTLFAAGTSITSARLHSGSPLPLWDMGVGDALAYRVHPVEELYYRECVVPLLDHPLVEWIGEVDDDAKAALLGEALALLVPVAWEEPFGLVFIEALAAGTPVITRPRGSMPELLRHGEHGFLVESEDGLVAACRAVGTIDRVAYRAWALQRFSRQRMASEYERVYSAATTRRPSHAVAQPAARRDGQPSAPSGKVVQLWE